MAASCSAPIWQTASEILCQLHPHTLHKYLGFMNKLNEFPIFVVGSSRSGTTLLYSILLSSGEFAIYEAETLLLTVCQTRYVSLKKKGNYSRFINDWTNSKQFFRSGLDPVKFKREAYKHRHDYTDFLRFFMEIIAREQGKKRWAEQTPGHLSHMECLHKAFPTAKFIHVIRDGRDVAISRRKVGWTGTKSKDPLKKLLCAAKSWEMAIKEGQTVGKELGNRYIEIRYEDIITNLDDVLREINNFAQINIDRRKIEDSSVGSLGKGNTAFEDKMDGISNRGLNRWKKELTENEICDLHLAIGGTLQKLKYEVGTVNTRNVPLGIKGYLIVCPVFLRIKSFLKQKTLLGRLTSERLEIGLR